MEKKAEFKSGKETLRGSMFIPSGKGPFPSVIFFHGSGGNGETYFKAAKKLSESGILGFAFNYGGCGISDGKFEDQTIAMGIEDARMAIKFFISQKEVDKAYLGFSGSSFGGFIASLFSVEFNPKSIALIAPASYSAEVYSAQRDSDNDFRKNFERSDSYSELLKFKGNLLIVRCEFDDVLPVGMVEKYIEAARNARKNEEYVLKGAKHRVSINPAAQVVLINKIESWFSETL